MDGLFPWSVQLCDRYRFQLPRPERREPLLDNCQDQEVVWVLLSKHVDCPRLGLSDLVLRQLQRYLQLEWQVSARVQTRMARSGLLQLYLVLYSGFTLCDSTGALARMSGLLVPLHIVHDLWRMPKTEVEKRARVP